MTTHSEDDETNDPGSAMGAFFGSFGNMDIYAQLVLEEFMEMILDETEK
jgi:hypothetical protein